MHQDSLRSVVYRSFVTCDDPKGVVECGTIRKSKSSPQKLEHKIKTQKPKQNTPDSYLEKKKKKKKEKEIAMVSKGIAEEEFHIHHSPLAFQVLEVSRGAQNLNQMTDTLSKGKGYDGDVAQDLLKGALELQESLVMLGKLQEASKYMAWLKKKQKVSNEVGIRRTNSCTFGDGNDRMGFQKPRLSADGDCYEELRNCIRDGLAKQNLLPKKHTEEKIRFHQRYMDSASEFASTSSSQSSLSHTNNFSSTDSPFSSTASEKKAKGPNLIAKLMGLEEIPSKPLHNQLKNEKIYSPKRPTFDVEMRKMRKPQSVGQQEKPEKRTLKEILDTMHFTGLMKRKSVSEFDSHSQQRLIGNTPPIVLIKPLCGQFKVAEEPFTPMFEEKDVQGRKLPEKLKGEEEFPLRTGFHKEKALKPGRVSKNADTEESPIKRLSKVGGAKESKKVAEKPEEVNIKHRCSNKKNAHAHAAHQSPEKEVTEKKDDKNPKGTVTSRKPKEKASGKSPDETKVSAKMVRKPENASNAPKSQTRLQKNKSTTSNHMNQTANHTGSTSHSLTNWRRSQIRREKLDTEPTTTRLTTENIVCKEDEKSKDFTSEVDSAPIDSFVDQVLAEMKTDASEFQIRELCSNSESSLSSAKLQTSESERENVSIEEVDDETSHLTESKSFNSGPDLNSLLLRNPRFLHQAEMLFDLNVNHPTSSQTSGRTIDSTDTDERLSVDYAIELLTQMSLPDSKMVHPLLLTWLKNPRICVPLEQLLEEIHVGVEILKSYCECSCTNLSNDNIYALLEKDIHCRGVVSGVWDLGWRSEFTAQDSEQVVIDIEKQVLSSLIDEILYNL